MAPMPEMWLGDVPYAVPCVLACPIPFPPVVISYRPAARSSRRLVPPAPFLVSMGGERLVACHVSRHHSLLLCSCVSDVM